MAKKSKQKQSIPSLFLLKFESENRRQEIGKQFELSPWVGEVIEDFQTRGTGRLYVGLILDSGGNFTHFCRLMRRIGSAGLNRVSVALSEFESLAKSDSAALLAAIEPSLSKKRKDKSFDRLRRLLPEENLATITMLDLSYPELASRIRQKGKADDRVLSTYSEHEKEVLILERDGLGLALEIAFGARESIVVDRVPKEKVGSFLDFLGDERFIEDEVIGFDRARFPGMEGVLSESPRTKIFKHRGASLEVIHANRTALENTLGVDLIYISHYFKSLIGVQYKMLEGDGDKAQFSPDDKFPAQLDNFLLS